MENSENLTGGESRGVSPDKHTVPLKRRIWLEIKDIFAGTAFAFIAMLVLGTLILSFAASDDLGISLAALIGGEIMIAVALVTFGRANGKTAYGKTVLNTRKRALGSNDEKVVCGTGEYSIWKGVLIGAILCIPFVIFQIVELCYDNSFCSFCLKYIFGWAYFPFSYLGKSYQALNFILILLPIGAHTLGYYLGKLRQIKIQQAVAEQYSNKKRRKK